MSSIAPSAALAFPSRGGRRRDASLIPCAVVKYKGTQMRVQRLSEMIEKKVIEAQEVCAGSGADSHECRVAWDEVEEVSQAKADLRLKLEVENRDPLESFCRENPDTDECRVYDD
ncbi:hypothetical protein MLD38_002186 [Melastoma candidum]|uniref:Uncharacterized protein n=1 Tax=Melastoma candidum TaxID=119954 RepID=A0ACB9SF10_9MYRT|nr:hypothetical protein MLD38_002186 [Melastoma candidum]